LTHIRLEAKALSMATRSSCLPRPRTAARLGSRIEEGLREPFRPAVQSTAFSASVGLGAYPQDGHSAQVAVQRADEAMNPTKTPRSDAIGDGEVWAKRSSAAGAASSVLYHAMAEMHETIRS
jgi:GGDEF domain-containing protein